jgi:hypothetical protein
MPARRRSTRGVTASLTAVGLTLTLLTVPTHAADAPPSSSSAPRAKRRHVVQGLLIGAGAGALLGFGLHHCPPENDPQAPPCPRFSESMIDTALVLGALGAGVGYVIRTDVRPVFLHGRGDVAILPRRRGVAVAATLRF